MSEQRFIRYGARTQPMEPGMTLEAAKEVMARHFPELANAKVETKKEGDKTIYVFSKQAGHKGASQKKRAGGTQGVADHLKRLRRVEIVPAEAMAAARDEVLEEVRDAYDPEGESPLFLLVRRMRAEAAGVQAAGTAVLDLPPAVALRGSVL